MKNKILSNICFFLIVLLISFFSTFLLPNLLEKFLNLSTTRLWLSFYLIALFFSILTYIGLVNKLSNKSIIQFLKELRIRKLKAKDILIIVVSSIAIIIINAMMQALMQALPIGDLFSKITLIKSEPVSGNMDYEVILMTILGFLLATIAEETFWRGYLLPLQEKQFGKMAWIVNGIFWAMSHILTHNPLRIIPVSLGIAFIGTRFKNTSITILIHLIINLVTINKLIRTWLSLV